MGCSTRRLWSPHMQTMAFQRATHDDWYCSSRSNNDLIENQIRNHGYIYTLGWQRLQPCFVVSCRTVTQSWADATGCPGYNSWLGQWGKGGLQFSSKSMQDFHLLHKSPQATIMALNLTVPIQPNRTHHDGWIEGGKAQPAIFKLVTSPNFMKTASFGVKGNVCPLWTQPHPLRVPNLQKS
jgi:hypothetical protein